MAATLQHIIQVQQHQDAPVNCSLNLNYIALIKYDFNLGG